jgi:hypothetical protein
MAPTMSDHVEVADVVPDMEAMIVQPPVVRSDSDATEEETHAPQQIDVEETAVMLLEAVPSVADTNFPPPEMTDTVTEILEKELAKPITSDAAEMKTEVQPLSRRQCYVILFLLAFCTLLLPLTDTLYLPLLTTIASTLCRFHFVQGRAEFCLLTHCTRTVELQTTQTMITLTVALYVFDCV